MSDRIVSELAATSKEKHCKALTGRWIAINIYDL